MSSYRSSRQVLEPLRVFLCHASEDKVRTRELYDWLVKCGVDAWLDTEKLLPGQKWEVEIRKAIRNSDTIIVCLSNHATNKTGFVHKETKIAIDCADERPDDTIFLIPIRFEACDVPKQLEHLQYADVFTSKGRRQLLDTLKVCASALERGIANTDYSRDFALYASKCFEKAFVDLFWRRNMRENKKTVNRFTVVLMGGHGTGKTALLYVLNKGHEGVSLLDREPRHNEACRYRVTIDDCVDVIEPHNVMSGGQCDVSADMAVALIKADLRPGDDVQQLLDQLSCIDIPTLVAINQVDRLDERVVIHFTDEVEILAGRPVVPLSAATGLGIEELKKILIYAARW